MGVRKDILDAVLESGWTSDVSDVIYRTFQYAERRNFRGACHALSSVLYVAMSELGFSPELCIGECNADNGMKPFDHSWVRLEGKIVDVAISMPLPHVPSFCGIVVGNVNLSTGTPVSVQYGVRTDVGFCPETQAVLCMSFCRYMDAYPRERNGLWTVVGRVLDKSVDVDGLRRRYGSISRTIVNDGGFVNCVGGRGIERCQ